MNNVIGRLMIAKIYVDDTAFGGMPDKMVEHFVHQMQFKFEMSLVGELTYFFRIQVKQMEDIVFVSQSKYARSIVKNLGFEKASYKITLAEKDVKLTRDENGVDMDQSLTKSMIRSLFYLTISRHDITFFLGVCARYQAKPKANHLTQVKRIMKHLNGLVTMVFFILMILTQH